MSIGNRIKELRNRLNLSQSKFSEKYRVPLDTLKKYEGDKRTPGGDALIAFSRAGADIDYILTGHRTGTGDLQVKEEAGDYIAIPLIDVRAAAGDGAIIESENVVDVLHFKAEWIHNELHASPAELKLIFVDGESMEPMLRAGDIILINISDQTPRRDGIYVLRLEDALLVKRLQRLPNHRLKVSSDNPAYEPFELSLPLENNSAQIIGRVVWMGRRI